ncbi:alpha/beta hydrolase, partial [Phenylobacterium sp.]|uniref:alpha/beta fold hydrolase n=1 Tax=Phenylobacterium sp. TaxID=1871053 RepID=UPI002F3E3D51
DTWDRLDQISCPVLIAAGRYDGIALPKTQDRMADRIAGSKLRFFEGGHMFMLQDRAALPAMLDFLSGKAQNYAGSESRPSRRLRVSHQAK